jgi:hypothetical protein
MQRHARDVHVYDFVMTEFVPYHQQFAARLALSATKMTIVRDALHAWSKYYHDRRCHDREALVKCAAVCYENKAADTSRKADARGVHFSEKTLYMSWQKSLADTSAHARELLQKVCVLFD